eukprot:9830585-Lingulodinium_polyedra.AAC.1
MRAPGNGTSLVGATEAPASLNGPLLCGASAERSLPERPERGSARSSEPRPRSSCASTIERSRGSSK